jgi:hypothetical protein
MTRNCTQAEITATRFEPQYLKVGTGSSARHIAYLYRPSQAGGQQRPGIVRLAGIRSDMRAIKAVHLDRYAAGSCLSAFRLFGAWLVGWKF